MATVYLVIPILFIISSNCVAAEIHQSSSSSSCLPTDTKCEFWLTIEERLVLHKEKIRVYAKDGILYKHDEGPDNHRTKVL